MAQTVGWGPLPGSPQSMQHGVCPGTKCPRRASGGPGCDIPSTRSKETGRARVSGALRYGRCSAFGAGVQDLVEFGIEVVHIEGFVEESVGSVER